MYKNADTGRNFEPIFMKFRSTREWTLLFLDTIGPIEPQKFGKMWPQNQFFEFKSDGMEFFKEKT